MNVNYNDGRTEWLTGLTPKQVAEHAKRVTADPAFESADITRKQKAYEPNRHERRKLAAKERKKGKN